MRCPECGANGYSRKTKTPEWRCRKCSHEWDVVPDNLVPQFSTLSYYEILTPNKPRLAILRLLNIVGFLAVFAGAFVGLFFLQLVVILPLQKLAGTLVPAAGWLVPSAVGEDTHPMYWVVLVLKVVLILGLSWFISIKIYSAVDRKIEDIGLREWQ